MSRIVFIDTLQRSCLRCEKPFTVRFASVRKRYCSKGCAMSVVASKRKGDRNSNWRGGKTEHPLYDTYLDMIARCHRSTHARYADYGGRGIQVCARWRESFWNFVTDMGERPAGRSLDRRDNDGPYAPENCRWATDIEQRHNRRDAR